MASKTRDVKRAKAPAPDQEEPARRKAQENRREDILVAAARLFSTKGFEAATVRDIADAADMLSGSVYYHFASKEEIFFAVYEAGIEQIITAVEARLGKEADPWLRLEQACIAHLTTLLGSPFSAVIAPNFTQDAVRLRQNLIQLRNRYDNIFKGLVEALPLPDQIDRKLMRLQVLGALNWTPYWYRPGGSSPRHIARHLIRMLRTAADGPSSATKEG
jgi:AcrR family transcriptional regulator